ncbi:winged helix-turn-helix transcriptional regulator [Spirosoma montaniterrae]|uniref:HxlR family transcriptional regulator n=1 Tax=Spirosoma montaniterrae TaxID=1178516 RepID=A0A1P9WXF3_9BACT|nr:helix-turn-helix domain-containing protein [Spirosoma montaniterrae]AQG80072.1 HxlR family transcriptional regulator [Spirosoma montaniterrae]
MSTNSPSEFAFEPDLRLINMTLKVIGGKWRLYLILVLGQQTLRFSELSERLPDVSPKVLAGELKALVALGVIQRVVYAEVPPKVEYRLTEQGRLALPLMSQLQQIGQFFI